ncbi:MAG: hypothetical protein ABI221_02350 [Candidatus Saccharimonadales bacterium]
MIKLRASLAILVGILTACLISSPVLAILYGSGTYGNCTYDGCSITITTSGTINIDALPTAGGSCTTQKDTVAVLTHSGTGYSLTATSSTTNTNLVSGGNNIPTSGGTIASPSPLSNSWGLRVDGLGGFGAGPTTPQTNGTTSSVGFAGLPPSSGTPLSLASTTGYNASTVNTSVWYGICANTTVPSGTYTSSVLYTAVVNP